LLWLGLAALIASAALWLVFVAADITGEPWTDVVGDGMAWAVLTDTQFGRVAQGRLLFAGVLALLLLWPRHGPDDVPSGVGALAAVIAALLLGSLALTGHAAGASGFGGWLHLCSDVLHLLAAGTWVGGLVPLTLLLRQSPEPLDGRWIATCRQGVHRFSNLGMVSVATLLASGLLNTWFLTDRMAGLIGTEYGRLVQVKIGLFLAMLCVAAVNRFRLLPQISLNEGPVNNQRNAQTLRQLQRNTAVEIAFGLAAICVVGVLGVTPPAGHIHH
jgi:putative copper resistance protein D